MKFIHYLTIIFFCGTLMFPGIAYDPVIEYHRLHKRYVWLTPPVFLVIHNESSKYNNVIDDDVCAIIQLESGDYCSNNLRCMLKVRSHSGAVGLMQIMPFHHRGPTNDLEIPTINVKYGTRYYSWCLKHAKGNQKEALRFYNAGPYSRRSTYRNWWYVAGIIKRSSRSAADPNPYYVIR